MTPEQNTARQRKWYADNIEEQRERCRQYRVNNPEKRRTATSNWRKKNPEVQAVIAKRYREKNREKLRVEGRLRRGLPQPTRPCPERCEICGNVPRTRALHLDHCHVTGEFRGWLCNTCNRALGYFKDNIVSLRQAIKYLKGVSSV